MRAANPGVNEEFDVVRRGRSANDSEFPVPGVPPGGALLALDSADVRNPVSGKSSALNRHGILSRMLDNQRGLTMFGDRAGRIHGHRK